MLKLGNTSDSSGHGSQRNPRRVLLGLHDLPPLNCEETVSPQLLATEPLKIKGITRDQSAELRVLISWCPASDSWQGKRAVPTWSPLWPAVVLCLLFPSLLATLRTTPCLPEGQALLRMLTFLWSERARFLKVGLLLVSPQKLLALQAYLFPFSTLFWNTFSASFDANFMTLPVGNILLKEAESWVMKVVKAVN